MRGVIRLWRISVTLGQRMALSFCLKCDNEQIACQNEATAIIPEFGRGRLGIQREIADDRAELVCS